MVNAKGSKLSGFLFLILCFSSNLLSANEDLESLKPGVLSESPYRIEFFQNRPGSDTLVVVNFEISEAFVYDGNPFNRLVGLEVTSRSYGDETEYMVSEWVTARGDLRIIVHELNNMSSEPMCMHAGNTARWTEEDGKIMIHTSSSYFENGELITEKYSSICGEDPKAADVN